MIKPEGKYNLVQYLYTQHRNGARTGAPIIVKATDQAATFQYWQHTEHSIAIMNGLEIWEVSDAGEWEQRHFYCSRCARLRSHTLRNTITTGYATAANDPDRKTCFACCAKVDAEYMRSNARITLYLTGERGAEVISNWCGTLKMKADYVRRGKHNLARTRYDVWFRDTSGARWYGVQYGENTQLIHCRKLKG